MLQKPRRNWWVAPGGKMEQGETVREAVIREYREETGIYLKHPDLKGVFTIVIKDGDKPVSEWMMFTFVATDGDGKNFEQSAEGILQWHAIDEMKNLPMAAGIPISWNIWFTEAASSTASLRTRPTLNCFHTGSIQAETPC